MGVKKRNLMLAGLAALAVILAGGVIGWQAWRTRKGLEQDGYIDWVSESQEYEQIHVPAGRGWKYVYPDKMTVRDQEGVKYVVDKTSFIHYTDGSVGAFSGGIVLDTNRIGAGMVQPYYLQEGIMLVKRDSSYYIENNGAEIEFRDFVWKLSKDHYLLSGESMALELPEDTGLVPEEYVELRWVEDGIVQVITGGQMWQGVTGDARVTWGGGVLDLSDRILSDEDGSFQISLDALSVDDEDVIPVASTAESYSTEHPSWNFTVIDGTDGADGEAGEAGEDGAAGEAGQQGADGETGSDGDAGAAGEAGAQGERGSTAFSQLDTEAVIDAQVEMNAYEPGLHGIAGALRLTVGDWELRNLSLAIRRESGGLEAASVSFEMEDGLYLNSGGWILEGAFSQEDDEVYELVFSYGDDLEEDTQYHLVLAADYYNEEVHMGNKVFLNRSFYTDSRGVNIRQEGVTEQTASFLLSRQDTDEAISLTLYDSSRNELYQIPTDLGKGTGGLSAAVELDGLEPDSTYYLGVLHDGVEGEVWEFLTLKRLPELGVMKAQLGVGRYTLYYEGNSDPDGAIVGYTYEIYDENLGDSAVKELSSSAKDGAARAIIDNQILYYNTEYRARGQVICYDNEKYVRWDMELEDDPNTVDYDEGVLRIAELEFPSFAPIAGQYELEPDSFGGWLRLQIPADTVYQVYYGGRDENPIYLMVLSYSGEYREPVTFTYTWEALLDPASVKIDYPAGGGGRVNLDVYVELDDLDPETDYYLYLYGDYANLAMIEQDMPYASGFGLLGSCKITTGKE